MRNSGRNYDHITLGQLVSLAALDLRADELTRPGLLLACDSSSRHEGRVALDNIDDVRLFFVHLDLARLVAMAARHREIRLGDQRSSFTDRASDFVVAHIS